MIQRILCVCRGNTCRSPMLEALVRLAIATELGRNYYARNTDLGYRLGRVTVESAGTYVDVTADCLNSPANEHAVTCMSERGIDITSHRSRPVSVLRINDFDLIVCMGDAEVEFVTNLRPRGAVMLANATNGGVPNPWQKGLAAYRESAAAIEAVAESVLNIVV